MTDAPRTIAARIGDDLPRIDVIELANTRRIMHAERHNDGSRMPMFIPTAAWARLLELHCTGDGTPDRPRLAPSRMMDGLERALGRIMTEVARHDATDDEPLRPAYVVTSDLFGAEGPVDIRMVVDRTTGVACMLAGPPADIAALGLDDVPQG
ncbi:hypothetical protein LV478_04335 [Komagataeibacter oboediens]|uniref:Uncharacterized protein n=1 Tax=Komagataeibacter xylinus NBRC 13693 TaxID=1234668 RepID=A0A0D6Q7W4_KOMXY|nr:MULTISPECIES: hypothetical protein [Komagataeibacter]MBV0887448.1 hypothetical protein [Komagataeibacter oboediens]MCK9819810.1 hypothetical protein [Komagataeibacter oboediens]WEQ52781.1 hypothetical protein LV478_04335 [Komagataeibacter oboediens]GAN99060.1 hypothetical protein Gxy13693_016_003 [Komagataeibacter xylinus NBRC 13693]